MNLLELSEFSLEHEIVSNDIVVIEFWAPWCESCKAFAPVFAAAAEKFPDIRFATVNADQEPEVAKNFGLKAVPTVCIFREQIMVFSEAGAPPPPAFDDVLNQVRALDMDKVKADISAQKA